MQSIYSHDYMPLSYNYARLSADHGKKIAVIENEFGEVGIDQSLVNQKFFGEENIFEMNNGCIW